MSNFTPSKRAELLKKFMEEFRKNSDLKKDEIATLVGTNIGSIRQWIRKEPDLEAEVFPGAKASKKRARKEPREHQMIIMDEPKRPKTNPNVATALSLLGNVEGLIKSIREMLEG